MQNPEELSKFVLVPALAIPTFDASWIVDGQFVLPSEEVKYRNEKCKSIDGIVSFIGGNYIYWLTFSLFVFCFKILQKRPTQKKNFEV